MFDKRCLLGLLAPLGLLSIDSADSSDIASRSSVRCLVPVLMPDSVRSVPIPPMTQPIVVTLPLLLTPSTQPIVATLPLLLKIYMQQAMESLSRDDSQQRDRDPERSKRRET